MNELIMAILIIIGTCLLYIVARWFYRRVYFPLFIPVITSSLIIILLLMIFNIPYETYMVGGDIISKLLGPAVVALAFPLYTQRKLLKQLAIPIVIGTFFGAIIGVTTGVLFTRWIGFPDEIIYSISPKSVTTPVAMEVANSLGGYVSLAAVFVIIAGIVGAVSNKYIYKLFRLNHYVGRGVGIGSGSHAIGTVKALEDSEIEGSISTVAMILSMIYVSILAPIIVHYLL